MINISEFEVLLKIEATAIISKSLRFDLGIKYNYAKSLINLGYVPPVFVQDYLEHVNVFNSFYEEEPLKRSPDDFVTAFDRLIQSIKVDGYQESEDKIYITAEGELANGAHRVSTLAALGRQVIVHEISENVEVYDFEYFHKKKLSENVSDRGIIGSLENESNIRLLIVYPVVPNQFDGEIEFQISKRGSLFFKKWLPGNLNLITNIKLINYYIHGDQNHLDWVGDFSNKFRGIQRHAEESMGSGRIRIYLIKDISDEDFLNLKADLRSTLRVGNFSLHGADSIEETQAVIQAVCHPESLMCAKQGLNAASLNLVVWLKEMSHAISADPGVRNKFCIGGSGPLGAFGAREIFDLDLLTELPLDTFRTNSFVSFHDIREIPYVSSILELLIDPEKHFYFLGFKFIAVSELKKMKSIRKESKDVYDLRLIDGVMTSKTFWNSAMSLGSNQLKTLIYWRLRHRLNKTLTSAKVLLLRHQKLVKILKKLKALLTFRL